jgi:hypothetical protein
MADGCIHIEESPISFGQHIGATLCNTHPNHALAPNNKSLSRDQTLIIINLIQTEKLSVFNKFHFSNLDFTYMKQWD